ncbi:hypothetical protein ACKQTC_07310 [Peptococcus simiae]|uniref:Uncharacterized protein n=1 Tax=Peptococcus simiae TaxID=1643805 RepID=A0ABW9H045_9FIRM
MDNNQYSSILGLIVPPLVNKIAENSNLSTLEAAECLYQSDLYKDLADENLKLWHYSVPTLYSMFQDELLVGSYDFPEGV